MPTVAARRWFVAVALAVGVAALPACSSGGDEVASTTSTTVAPTTTVADDGGGDDTTTTTSTSVAPDAAPCTADAIGGAVAGMSTTVEQFGCADGYAWAWLGKQGDPAATTSVVLRDESGQWVELSGVCGGASAGYPPEVLDNGCRYAPGADG